MSGRVIALADAGIPAPPPLTSDVSPWLLLAVFGVIVVAAIAWAISLAVKNRDLLPIACCAGALVASFNEPIYDILGKIVYAENNPMAFTAFGRAIPWFLVIGYLPWVGLAPYIVYKKMEAGISRRTLHIAAALLFVSVVIIETFGNLLHLWLYYGEAPMKFLVVAPQQVALPMLGGFLLYALAGQASGWRRPAIGFVVAAVALPIVYAGASWPVYVALYADRPAALDWILSAVMLGLCVGFAVASTSLAEKWRAGLRNRQNNPRADPALV
ncbi:hypothetical protein [Mycobacterium sp.]|uniref:hypothetical protein n=1 Tax=Mycobacterium sp. TaxID=1785 RepID=UPI003C78DE0D